MTTTARNTSKTSIACNIRTLWTAMLRCVSRAGPQNVTGPRMVSETVSERRGAERMLTDEVVHPVAHHVGGLGGAVEAEVLGHCLLLLGWLTHLLKHTHTHTCTHTQLHRAYHIEHTYHTPHWKWHTMRSLHYEIPWDGQNKRLSSNQLTDDSYEAAFTALHIQVSQLYLGWHRQPGGQETRDPWIGKSTVHIAGLCV